jgi:hypothetical protein
MIEERTDRRTWVYDIETIFSIFTYTAINIDTEEVVQYVIHPDRNDVKELVDHLSNCKGLIGFNNLNFDYPVIHELLCNYTHWSLYYRPYEIVAKLYEKAQELISNQNKEGYFPSIQDKYVKIPQLDLFRLWHYNNKARMTSLKSLEISMNYPNVMDMPIDHTREDIELSDIPEILEYNLNDVLATFEFFKKSLPKIDLRKQIKQRYGLPCTNASDSSIGERLLLTLYCNKLGLNPWDVKKMRTYRHGIPLKDVIFDYVEFKSKEFNRLLDYFNGVVVKSTKNAFAESVIFKGFKYDYGTGGIHGCIYSGIYKSNDDYVLIDCDVASLYPNIAIKNGLFIEHLGKEFIDIYDNDIVQERLKAKAAGNMSISDALKLSANSVYGKSNDANSFLYDPKYTMATTINGQLVLSMLAESLVLNIKGLLMVQVNTDGITVKIRRDQQDLYYQLCKEWEAKTKLTLEYAYYDKMIIRDVNNYMAITDKGKIKYKGVFEIDKVVGNEPAYHKDNSFRVVKIAISDYFVKGISVEQTIKNHRNIYDFCGRQKFGSQSKGELQYPDENGNIAIAHQQKNVRYYISKSGKVLIKRYSSGETERINKGYEVEIFNSFVEKEWNDYRINYDFYIEEAMKIINIIDTGQTSIEF